MLVEVGPERMWRNAHTNFSELGKCLQPTAEYENPEYCRCSKEAFWPENFARIVKNLYQRIFSETVCVCLQGKLSAKRKSCPACCRLQRQAGRTQLVFINTWSANDRRKG